MGRKDIKTQIVHELFNKQAFGESRFLVKQELRQNENYRFGDTDNRIHSIVTFNTYKTECEKYADWLVNTKGIKKYTELSKTVDYAKEYIEYRLSKDGVSVWTAKMERSALSKLYNVRIDVDMPKRDTDAIKRSRGQEKINHFSEKNNQEIVNMAKATGCRRADLLTIRPCDFWQDRYGNLFVNIYQSKGGRNRTAPILPQYKEFVKEYIKDKQNTAPLFTKIKQHMDVHSYRRDYARSLYNAVITDKDLKTQLLERYPERHEYKTIKDKETNECKTVEIASPTYKSRSGEVFGRDDAYIVTQSLGHNRLEVTIQHYISR